MTRLLIFGPPGAGKGTQAAKVAAALGVPAISTGDIFRSNVAQGTELGLQVKAVMADGGYVSDELTNALVRDRLCQEDARNGFLLDGYPRTAAQVAELDSILGENQHHLDRVLVLEVAEDTLVQRLLRRAELENRSDDDEVVITNRLRIYRRETEPLAQAYAERGLLSVVNGEGEVDDVTQRLLAALNAPADQFPAAASAKRHA